MPKFVSVSCPFCLSFCYLTFHSYQRCSDEWESPGAYTLELLDSSEHHSLEHESNRNCSLDEIGTLERSQHTLLMTEQRLLTRSYS
jgi:hypothetical protein